MNQRTKNKATCGMCKKAHPTPLHEDHSAAADTSSSHAMEAKENTPSLFCSIDKRRRWEHVHDSACFDFFSHHP